VSLYSFLAHGFFAFRTIPSRQPLAARLRGSRAAHHLYCLRSGRSREMKMQIKSQPDLQFLINQGTQWLDSYLRQFEEGKEKLSNNMLGIYEGASSHARAKNSLEWARIAVRAAELYALEESGKHREYALQKVMKFRAAFIAKMGSRSGDSVLDKEIVVCWVTEGIRLSIDEVKDMSARFKNRHLSPNEPFPLDEIRELHRIRARIGVARTLMDCGELANGSWLDEWINMETLHEIP
jgi:hypothetical protein